MSEQIEPKKRKNLLHSILALEPDSKGRAEKITRETIITFKSKQEHFRSSHKTYEPKAEEGLKYPDENKEMVTTVTKKLSYTQKQLSETIDVVYQKELTNLVAQADLEVDGIVLKEKVPATALLNLEARLKSVREIYNAIPTLPPGQDWQKDPERDDVYKTKPIEKFKMEKQSVAFVLAEATDKHPAQVEKESKDVPIGTWTEIKRDSSWTSAEKSEKLGRIDNLIAAVKKARQEANTVPINNDKIAKVIFDYINKGTIH